MQSDFITKKDLIPSKLGLTGEYLAEDLYNEAVKGISNISFVDEEAKLLCVYILYRTCSDHNSARCYSFPSYKTYTLTETDVKIITSDIAEIASALYVLTHIPEYSGKKVKFYPPNEMLIDFEIDGKKFSSKTGSGAKNSLSSLCDFLKINGIHYSIKKNAMDVLDDLVSNRPNYENIINAAETIDSNVIQWLDMKIGVMYWWEDPEKLSELLVGIHTYDELMNEFGEYFRLCDFTPNITVVERLLNNPRKGKDRPWGILHFPLTSFVVKWLNNSDNARRILSECANNLNVTQVYLDVVKDRFRYTVKEFKDAEFTFGTASSTARPTKNRIGFKMIKGRK